MPCLKVRKFIGKTLAEAVDKAEGALVADDETDLRTHLMPNGDGEWSLVVITIEKHCNNGGALSDPLEDPTGGPFGG